MRIKNVEDKLPTLEKNSDEHIDKSTKWLLAIDAKFPEMEKSH
jgi:hypothetical protein